MQNSRVRAALAHIEIEGQAAIRQLARREPAKVISIRGGISPRHAYNLREEIGQPKLAWPAFIALAQQYPEIRALVANWLGFDNKADPKAEALLDQIRRMVEAGPEEGDRS